MASGNVTAPAAATANSSNDAALMRQVGAKPPSPNALPHSFPFFPSPNDDPLDAWALPPTPPPSLTPHQQQQQQHEEEAEVDSARAQDRPRSNTPRSEMSAATSPFNNLRSEPRSPEQFKPDAHSYGADVAEAKNAYAHSRALFCGAFTPTPPAPPAEMPVTSMATSKDDEMDAILEEGAELFSGPLLATPTPSSPAAAHLVHMQSTSMFEHLSIADSGNSTPKRHNHDHDDGDGDDDDDDDSDGEDEEEEEDDDTRIGSKFARASKGRRSTKGSSPAGKKLTASGRASKKGRSPRRGNASGRSSTTSTASSGSTKRGKKRALRSKAEIREQDSRWDPALMTCPIQDLRRWVKENNLSKEDEDNLKDARRRYQGRTHKRRSRAGLTGSSQRLQELREQAIDLKRRIAQAKGNVAELKREWERLKAICKQHGVDIDRLCLDMDKAKTTN